MVTFCTRRVLVVREDGFLFLRTSEKTMKMKKMKNPIRLYLYSTLKPPDQSAVQRDTSHIQSHSSAHIQIRIKSEDEKR